MRFDFTRQEEKDNVYTVAELNRKVRDLIESNYSGIWVEAEVVEVTRARSGHIYFSLTDPGGKASLSAVMWHSQALRYGSRVVEGSMIRCFGRLTIYEARGTYQIVVDRAEEAGAGIKARKLAELKARLEAEGLFAPERKRPLPLFPSCIGVVTSRSGAAIKDIIKVASRRFAVRIVLSPAQVQGAEAPAQIAAALGALAKMNDVDVVIVGRGGGSSEDLDAFNSEIVVRAVSQHPHPVVSAVGHEMDVTLVDLAADRRAATPSEAAEIAVPDKKAVAETLDEIENTLKRSIERYVDRGRGTAALETSRLMSADPRVKLKRGFESLSNDRERLIRWSKQTLTKMRTGHAAASEPISRWPVLALAAAKGRLAELAVGLDALSPLACLARGYSVVRRRPDSAIVRSSEEAPCGAIVDVTLSKGSLVCAVKESKAD